MLPLALALCAAFPAAQEPQAWAVKDVRLEARDDAPRKTLFLRDGRVDQVLEASVEIPEGLRVLDGHGMLALPAFVDAYSFAGCAQPKIEAEKDLPPNAGSDLLIDMREANRKGIAPAFRAAQAFALDEEGLEPDLVISGINTFFTTCFILLEDLPHRFFLIVATFICGLLPIVGNIISNTIITCLALTISLPKAGFALFFRADVQNRRRRVRGELLDKRSSRNPFRAGKEFRTFF